MKTREQSKQDARDRAIRDGLHPYRAAYDEDVWFVDSTSDTIPHAIRTHASRPASCTCTGFEKSGHHWCKHMAAVEMILGDHAAPAPIDEAELLPF